PEGRKLAISARRMSDQLRFIAGLQYAFHADMKKHLRETLGCKQLFTTSNFHAMDKTMEDLENWTKTAGDIVCANTYVGGMHKGSNTGWRVDPGDIFDSVSCTREPLRLPMLKKQVGNRPYWVTETLWVNPHEYQNEAALLTAIYNGVSDVNAVFFAGPRDVTWAGNMYYAFTPDDGHGKAMMKWNCSEPGHMGSFAAAALIHRLGYAATPDPVVVERRTFDDMVGMKPSMIAEGGEYDPNRYAGGAMKGAEGGTVPQEAFLTGPVLVDFDPASQTKVAPVARAAATNRPVVSANGIVAADPAKGLVTLDSPRAQAAIGFLKSAGTVKLSSCTIVCDAGHAGIALVTLDGKPLKTADRILVQIAPRARPTGWKIEPIGDAAAGAGGEEWKIVNTGRLPFRVERLSGKITLSSAVIAKAEKLNENGEPSGPVPLRKKDGTVSLDLPGDALYVLLSK
ncbi:hypothetical protein GX586_16365, partial [bacterium]|nr:hypothetical protein [bacterium]